MQVFFLSTPLCLFRAAFFLSSFLSSLCFSLSFCLLTHLCLSVCLAALSLSVVLFKHFLSLSVCLSRKVKPVEEEEEATVSRDFYASVCTSFLLSPVLIWKEDKGTHTHTHAVLQQPSGHLLPYITRDMLLSLPRQLYRRIYICLYTYFSVDRFLVSNRWKSL